MARSVRPYRAPHSFKVVALQGHPVSADVPDVGDTLVWDGTEWVPTPMPSRVRSNDPTAFGETLNLDTTVVALQGTPVFPIGPVVQPGDALLWTGVDWKNYPVAKSLSASDLGPYLPISAYNPGGGGGDFLPLTGGVLSGPGALTVGDVLTVEGADSTNGVSLIDMPGLSGAVQTEGNGLLLQQLGDQYGLTSLLIANRDGLNGAMFTNEGLNLVDFAFQTSTGVTGTLRLDARTIPTGQFLFMLSGGTLMTIDSAGNVVCTGTLVRPGFTDGSNAAAGVVGEYMINQSQGGLVSGTAANIGSLSLTPGDWDVSGNVALRWIEGAVAANIQVAVGINTTPAVLPSGLGFNGADGSAQLWVGTPNNGESSLAASPKRYNVTTATTVYLNVQSFWSGADNPNVVGTIRARRMR